MYNFKVGQCRRINDNSTLKVKEWKITKKYKEKQLGGKVEELYTLNPIGVKTKIKLSVDEKWIDRNTEECKK